MGLTGLLFPSVLGNVYKIIECNSDLQSVGLDTPLEYDIIWFPWTALLVPENEIEQ